MTCEAIVVAAKVISRGDAGRTRQAEPPQCLTSAVGAALAVRSGDEIMNRSIKPIGHLCEGRRADFVGKLFITAIFSQWPGLLGRHRVRGRS